MYGELGYIADSEIKDASGSGDGILLGGGVRGLLFREKKFSLIGSGGLRYINEDYGHSVDGDEFEVNLGLLGRGQLNKEFGVFGGLDLLPYSSGTISYRNADVDIERETIIGLRLGADYLIQGVTIGAEFALISEETFLIRATFPL